MQTASNGTLKFQVRLSMTSMPTVENRRVTALGRSPAMPGGGGGGGVVYVAAVVGIVILPVRGGALAGAGAGDAGDAGGGLLRGLLPAAGAGARGGDGVDIGDSDGDGDGDSRGERGGGVTGVGVSSEGSKLMEKGGTVATGWAVRWYCSGSGLVGSEWYIVL